MDTSIQARFPSNFLSPDLPGYSLLIPHWLQNLSCVTLGVQVAIQGNSLETHSISA